MIRTSKNKMQVPERENCAYVPKQNGREKRPNGRVIVVFYIWQNKV